MQWRIQDLPDGGIGWFGEWTNLFFFIPQNMHGTGTGGGGYLLVPGSPWIRQRNEQETKEVDII